MKLRLGWKTKLVAGQQDVIASSGVGGVISFSFYDTAAGFGVLFCQITYETQLILMCGWMPDEGLMGSLP